MLVMFLLGALALIAWKYVMPRHANATAILMTAALYYGVGGLLAALALTALDLAMAGSNNHVLRGWMMLLAFVLSEELLKLLASRTQKAPANAFAIVLLFGIFELMVSKPLLMLLEGEWSLGADYNTLFVIPALTLHGLTAGIYAFAGRDRPILQMAACIGLHAAYNALADGFILPMAPDWLFLLLTLAFVAATVLLWRRWKGQPGRVRA